MSLELQEIILFEYNVREMQTIANVKTWKLWRNKVTKKKKNEQRVKMYVRHETTKWKKANNNCTQGSETNKNWEMKKRNKTENDKKKKIKK